MSKRKVSPKAKKAYGKLLLRAFKRFHPGGKGYAAVKKHFPSEVR